MYLTGEVETPTNLSSFLDNSELVQNEPDSEMIIFGNFAYT